MKINFLNEDPKKAAAELPASLRKKEISNLESIIATAIRLTRGKSGEILQTVKTAFGPKIDKVDSYPFVIKEDKPEQPFIELATSAHEPIVMWFLQSAGNKNYLTDYYSALVKLEEGEANENLVAALDATTFDHGYRGKTPPPYLFPKKHCIQKDVEKSYQDYIHHLKIEWDEGQAIPKWFNKKLNKDLTKTK